MIIEHVNAKSVDTDKLPDVDAQLLEESKKLQELYAKYNRQLLMVTETRGSNETLSTECAFYHIGPLTMTKEESQNAHTKFIARIDDAIRGLSKNQIGLAFIKGLDELDNK